MKVILLQDVKNVGKKDQIVEVSDGYAANFLFPKKFAVKLTNQSLYNLENEQKQKKIAEENKKQEALKVKTEIEKIVIEFTAPCSKDGRMFGTISPKQIEQELKSRYNIIIDKRKFIDKYPVNAFGYSDLKIELYKGIIATLRIHVTEKK